MPAMSGSCPRVATRCKHWLLLLRYKGLLLLGLALLSLCLPCVFADDRLGRPADAAALTVSLPEQPVSHGLAAGSRVLTPNGSIAISALRVGDTVWSLDIFTGALRSANISRTFEGDVRDGVKDYQVVQICVASHSDAAANGQDQESSSVQHSQPTTFTVSLGAQHGVWLESAHAWAPASELRSGDEVLLLTSQVQVLVRALVVSVARPELRAPVTFLYNIEVAETHNFFFSADYDDSASASTFAASLLVHNHGKMYLVLPNQAGAVLDRSQALRTMNRQAIEARSEGGADSVQTAVTGDFDTSAVQVSGSSRFQGVTDAKLREIDAAVQRFFPLGRTQAEVLPNGNEPYDRFMKNDAEQVGLRGIGGTGLISMGVSGRPCGAPGCSAALQEFADRTGRAILVGKVPRDIMVQQGGSLVWQAVDASGNPVE